MPLLQADLLSWPAVLSNSQPQANTFSRVTILLCYASKVGQF